MNKKIIATIVGFGLGLTTILCIPSCGKGNQPDNCVGCQQLQCRDDQLDSWCLVDITDPRAGCHFEQSFGYCLPIPDGGFAPSTNVRNWAWQLMYDLVKPMIAGSFGTYVGYELLECRVAATNPYYGLYGKNAIEGRLLASITVDNGPYPKPLDETQCEACAGGLCNLDSCGADQNCSCWVGCAFQDATLATCPGICGAQGGVTQSLVTCLVNSCGEACGVPGAVMNTCGGNSSSSTGVGGNGVGGSPTVSCQESGMDCSSNGDCCSDFCIGGSGGLMGVCN